MTKIRTRRGIALAVVAAVGVTVLASCSSDESTPEATETVSELVIEDALPTDSASASAADTAADTAVAATVAAAAACDIYFEIDLLNSAYAGGAVKDGDMTEKQVKNDMAALVEEFTVAAQAAVDDGSADAKLANNANRMAKIIGGLKKKNDLKDLSTAKQKNFAKASLRVQKACDRAGFPLPADNVTARTAAGL